jgi:hypothetical protein
VSKAAFGRSHRWASENPNVVRLEEGWPASSDPTADSIEPPAAGGKPTDDESEKVTPLPRRGR